MGQFKVVLNLLGRGSFGEVFEGEHVPTKQKLAVKIIKEKDSKIPIKIKKAQATIL